MQLKTVGDLKYYTCFKGQVKSIILFSDGNQRSKSTYD